MWKFIFFSLLLISVEASSQKATTKQAIAVSDSILKSNVGGRVSQYFHLSEGSYYTYADKHQKEWTAKFLSRKNLPKSFTTLNFLYLFDYPQIEGIRGGLWVIVDKDLRQINTFEFDFVPRFVIDNKTSNFVSTDTVLLIAKTKFLNNGLEIGAPELSYNEKLKRYEYTVCNKLTKTTNSTGKGIWRNGGHYNKCVDGKVEGIDKAYYGIVIR